MKYLYNPIVLIGLTWLSAFVAGWFGRPRGVCQESGKPARLGKCPVHGDGGALCGTKPEIVISDYHLRLRHLEGERDHFRGKVSRLMQRTRRATDSNQKA